MRSKLMIILLSSVILSGCFPNYKNLTVNKIDYGSDFVNYYTLRGDEPDIKNKNLIIWLDGSSWESAIGVKGRIVPWRKISLAYALQKYLSKDFDILVPDKLNYEFGKEYTYDYMNDYYDNPKIVGEYTMHNRVLAAKLVIDSFLVNENYKNVILMGYSEGGLILPRVYSELAQKDKITGLINACYGGMSYSDALKETAKEDTAMQSYIVKAFDEIRKYPEAIDKHAFGWPLRKWTDFMWYEPMKDYESINIPILLIHGNEDKNMTVESSRYMVKQFGGLGKNNLKYIEVHDDHYLSKSTDLIKVMQEWITSLPSTSKKQ
ncbi:MAG: hypothetical protein ACM3QX_17650 [Syntrophomonadaceae bacterium]